MSNLQVLNTVLSYFDASVVSALNLLDPSLLLQLNEIRLRRGRCLSLIVAGAAYFMDYNGDLYDTPSPHCITVNGAALDELFLKCCDYAVHLHARDIRQGFVTLENGVRIGVAGRAIYEDGRLLTVNDISALNIRLPSFSHRSADKLLQSIYAGDTPSILVAGPPGSGKTTLLRDLAVGLTDGTLAHCRRCCVVDERGELMPPAMQVRGNCDVLSHYRKTDGIEIAVRCFHPEIVICDEIATEQEAEQIRFGFSAGTAFALSVHAADVDALLRKPLVRKLLATGQFDYIVLLSGRDYAYRIFRTEGGKDEGNRSAVSATFHDRLRPLEGASGQGGYPCL